MPENPNQKEGIESKHDAGESEIKKGKDRIYEQLARTQKKTKGSNLSAMLDNPKQKEGSNPEQNEGYEL